MGACRGWQAVDKMTRGGGGQCRASERAGDNTARGGHGQFKTSRWQTTGQKDRGGGHNTRRQWRPHYLAAALRCVGGGHLSCRPVLHRGGDGTWLQSYVVVMNRMQLGAK